MKTRFTVGIEEEFQMVDRRTGQLCPRIQTIMEKGYPIFGEQIKPEQHQSMVELISDILPDIATARKEMGVLRAKLARLVGEEGLALVSAGTHPAAFGRRSPYRLMNGMPDWRRNFRTPHVPTWSLDCISTSVLIAMSEPLR